MTDEDFRVILRAELKPIMARLDGLPVINRAVVVLQQETRALKAAFNDFARTNVTAGGRIIANEP